jgi:hypothetical protein
MRVISISIIALALYGCDAAKKDAVPPVQPETDMTSYAEKVIALPKGQREAVLFRAIRDAGLPCQEITNVEQIQPIGGNPTWRAQCDGSDSHLIQIMPNGIANVVSRPTP